jgi:hypothetical protein
LRFTRAEWRRGLEGVTDEDAVRHLGPMNCISWTVGHLAWQEQRYWLEFAQGKLPHPQLNEIYAFGAPMSTPPFADSLRLWNEVTAETDPFLDTLSTDVFTSELLRDGRAVGQTYGSAMLRMTYHYWYHIGEIQATRQILGHTDLPTYVGPIESDAPYRPHI